MTDHPEFTAIAILVQRLASNIRFEPSGCWTWTGCVYRVPQVYLANPKRKVPVRQLTCRPPSRYGFDRKWFVTPTCGNDLCVNPAHMQFVRHGQKEAGNQPRSQTNFIPKLTAEQVQEIRARCERETQAAVAKDYGVSQMTISRVIRGVGVADR